MTSKLTILSIDPEAAGRDVRHLQETVLLLEQLRQLLENIGSRDLADRAAHAAGALQEAVRCIRESARKYENVELEEEVMTRAPVPAAPYTMLIAATSLSACRKQPPISGIRADMYSGISVCGVMG